MTTSLKTFEYEIVSQLAVLLLVLALYNSSLKTGHTPADEIVKVARIDSHDDLNSSLKKDEKIKVFGKGSYDKKGLKFSFEFQAIKENDGSVRGSIVYRGYDEFRADISCIIITGKYLAIGGVITQVGRPPTSESQIAVGQSFQLTFRDNGNGTGKPSDQCSYLSYGYGINCAYANQAVPLHLKGNIIIKK
jgi:hypothetical protein